MTGVPATKYWPDACCRVHCVTCRDPARTAWREKIAQHFEVPNGFVEGDWECNKEPAPQPTKRPDGRTDYTGCSSCREKMLEKMKRDT